MNTEIEILYQRLNQKRNFSYRRFERLTPKEKKIFTKSELSPLVKSLALKYKGVTKEPLDKSLTWAKRKYKKYQDYIINKVEYRRPIEQNEDYVYQELVFQGFVPESEFKKKAGFNYLQTNRKIKGQILIYPVHAAHDWELIRKGYPDIYSLLSVAGVPGWVKVDVKFERIKEKGNDGNKKSRKRRK